MSSSQSDDQTNELFRKILISASRGRNLSTWEAHQQDVAPGFPIPWSVRKEVLQGGRQDGVDRVVIDNGCLRFRVLPTRGMGLQDARMGDIRLGWDSPVKEVVHPHFIDLHSRGGLGWVEGFNEWVVRCGLEFAGAPGRDQFITNTGERSEMDLSLHGKIANIPAAEVELLIGKTPPYEISLVGTVAERMFHGPKLELQTKISTLPGSKSLQITDRITNCGGSEQEMQLIYHTNFGTPLLEQGAMVIAPIRRVFPINTSSAAHIREFSTYRGPTPGFVEEVFCVEPLAADDGRTTVLLRNRAGDQAVRISFPVDQLPYWTLWKNTASEEDGYVTGIEPGTGFPYNRRIERKMGRVPVLAPKEERVFEIEFEVLDSESAVAKETAKIERIQGDSQLILDESPPHFDF